LETNPQKNQSKKNLPNTFYRYSSLGIQMGATIFLFAFAGVKLDAWLALKFPVFTLVLTLAGVCGTMYYAIKEISKYK